MSDFWIGFEILLVILKWSLFYYVEFYLDEFNFDMLVLSKNDHSVDSLDELFMWYEKLWRKEDVYG